MLAFWLLCILSHSIAKILFWLLGITKVKMMRKHLATTAAVVFSILYQVHTKGYVTRCFFEGNSVTPSFSYDFDSGNIHDITCSDYCSCDGSRTGYGGCQKCCCSKAHKKTRVKGKEAAIISISLLAFFTNHFWFPKTWIQFFFMPFYNVKKLWKRLVPKFLLLMVLASKLWISIKICYEILLRHNRGVFKTQLNI